MASSSADFNYKVALASGLKSLQGGRLRQAEEQFRDLVQHFPSADGGYRGLAKVLVEQEDRPKALHTLLEGGAALAKAGQRGATIGLYREAVALDPHDLTAHRRLTAALALAGDTDASAHEYVRYVGAAHSAGDQERARLEAAYAMERLPGSSEIAELARKTGAPAAAAPTASAEVPATHGDAERDTLMRTAFGTRSPLAPPPAPDTWTSPAAPPAVGPAATATDGAAATTFATNEDSQAVEATAARLIAKGDPHAGDAALEAARRYLGDGRVDAASDLLLQLIARGVAGHEAQRLLVEVAKSLGKRDVARAKCQLLVRALRLDGRNDLAAEVEQLAQGF